MKKSFSDILVLLEFKIRHCFGIDSCLPHFRNTSLSLARLWMGRPEGSWELSHLPETSEPWAVHNLTYICVRQASHRCYCFICWDCACMSYIEKRKKKKQPTKPKHNLRQEDMDPLQTAKLRTEVIISIAWLLSGFLICLS